MTKRDDDLSVKEVFSAEKNRGQLKPGIAKKLMPRTGNRTFSLALLFLFSVSLSSCRGWWFWTPGDSVDNVGYHPEQPIQFTHNKHAGERKIPCQYCHSSARRSSSAGIPPSNTCMGCHKLVGTQLEPIKYLTEKYNSNKPIPWVKVHDLPDFVHFPHKQHIAAKLDCSACHGDMTQVETAKQSAPLQMGWCISCHQEKGASVDCQACHY